MHPLIDIHSIASIDRANDTPGRCVSFTSQPTDLQTLPARKCCTLRLHSGHFAFKFVQMRMQRYFIILALGTLLFGVVSMMPLRSQMAFGQEQSRHSDPDRPARKLLLGSKDAISSGNIRYLRPHLGQKVYLNLFTGINGYYSGEQAFLILESLFSTYMPISFSFSSRNFSIRNPYGFGPLTYERRGKRETAEMFLSLANVRGEWVINQITIAKR